MGYGAIWWDITGYNRMSSDIIYNHIWLDHYIYLYNGIFFNIERPCLLLVFRAMNCLPTPNSWKIRLNRKENQHMWGFHMTRAALWRGNHPSLARHGPQPTRCAHPTRSTRHLNTKHLLKLKCLTWKKVEKKHQKYWDFWGPSPEMFFWRLQEYPASPCDDLFHHHQAWWQWNCR